MRSKWFLGAALGAGLLMAHGQTCGAAALGTGFTYQGQLKQSGSPVNGTVDLDFTLWNDPAATDPGNQIGSVQSIAAVSVSSGLFTVQLNGGGEFGASAFNGEQRWLQISVNGTPLSPRQELTAAPNALFALNTATATTASNATNATQLNGQPASFYQNATNTGSGTLADARLSGNVALLGGAQTFTGIKTFSIKPSFAAAGTPFLVSNSTLVTNLNADLVDGLDSTVFAQLAAAQTWAGANTFSNAANSFAGSGAGLTGLNASNLSTGTLLNTRLPAGGAWSLSSNLSVDSGTLAIDQANNRVGIGTASPTAKLEIGGVAGTDGIKFPDGSLQVKAANILRQTTGLFDLAPLGAGASTTFGASVSGAALGSVVAVSPTSDMGAGIILGPAWVSSAGNIIFRVQNVSNVTVDPAATQFTIAVLP